MPISLGIGTAVTRGGGLYGPSPQLDLNFASLLSLTPSVGPTPSYTRASTGTYFDASGVLTTAAINGPRFDHVYNGSAWVSKGLLIEEARTNLCTYSSDQLNAAWLVYNATVTSSSETDPAGGTNAFRVAETTTSDQRHEVYISISPSASTFTYSVFAKAQERNWLQLTSYDYPNSHISWFNIFTGVVGTNAAGNTSTITPVGNGWYRCSVTRTVASTTGQYFQAGPANGDNNGAYAGDPTKGLLIYGAQVEIGAFPTSYIPTTTAAVTRSADVCEITGGDFSGFWNEPAGTLVAEGDTPASGTRSLVSANNTTANESSVLRTVGTDPLFVVTDGGVAQASIDAGTVSAETAFKLAAAYTVNDFAVSKDGAAVVTDTSGTIPTPTQITIGTDSAGNYVCGHIARLRYFNTRLLNSQLVALST